MSAITLYKDLKVKRCTSHRVNKHKLYIHIFSNVYNLSYAMYIICFILCLSYVNE